MSTNADQNAGMPRTLEPHGLMGISRDCRLKHRALRWYILSENPLLAPIGQVAARGGDG